MSLPTNHFEGGGGPGGGEPYSEGVGSISYPSSNFF